MDEVTWWQKSALSHRVKRSSQDRISQVENIFQVLILLDDNIFQDPEELQRKLNGSFLLHISTEKHYLGYFCTYI